MPSGVYPRAPLAAERMRQRIQRRRELGLPHIGRPAMTFTWVELICEACKAVFQAKLWPEDTRSSRRRRLRRFCSARCVCSAMYEKRRKVPADAELLRSLYWGDRLTTGEMAVLFGCISAAVLHQMAKLGIPRRVAKTAPHCLEGGCTKRRFQERGSRCREHWRAYQERFAQRHAVATQQCNAVSARS